ncbi:MAG: HDOD domain-containing protein [Zoogloeaceae bacterium]|jgi:EAL and modified HD-GYP domain-containing signal transduction protein|nr:HDOD domain-containing protein [Zoogloeaceae bacterium]
MTGFFRKLFGGFGVASEKESTAPPAQSRPLQGRAGATPAPEEGANVAANAAANADADADTRAEANLSSAFLCREALLGRDQKIVGYEFCHPQHLHPRFMDKRALVRQYCDDVLLRHLVELPAEVFPGARIALLEISSASLTHPLLSRLPRQNVALALAFPENELLTEAGVDEVIAVSGQFRAHGAKIGLKWQPCWLREARWLDLLPHVDFVQMSWSDSTEEDSGALLTGFRQGAIQSVAKAKSAAEPLRLIASDLKTPEDFQRCYRLGFDFFRGPFINQREPGKVSKSAMNRLRIMQLLNRLRHDAETSALTQELKQDPVLSYRLLRYVNSPALGLRHEITNLDQAMTILGRNTLYRWLSFLLFNVSDPGYYEWALTEQALSRAALMERLGKKVDAEGAEDALFLTGLFSLLDQLMGESLSELTAQIQIPEEIRLALVRREGVLARFLALAEACEQMIPETIAQQASSLGLSAPTVNTAVFEALAWAHDMTELSAG